MSQFFVAAQNGGAGAVTSIIAGNNISVSPGSGVGAVTVNVSGTTTDAVQIGNATGSLTSLALGTAGQILTSQGAGLPPIFSNPNTANAYVDVVGPTTYNVLLTDFFISVNATAGNVTIILPAAPGVNQEYVIKDRLGQATNHVITVNTQGADTIDGQATYLFTDPYESIDILFHGTNFEIF